MGERIKAFLGVVGFCLAVSSLAQTEGATWTSVTIQKKISDQFKVSIQPQLRWSDKNLERRLFETSVEYQQFKFLSTEVTHRFTSETTKSGNYTYHRMAFDLKGQLDVNNWEPEVRLRYTNIKDFNPEGGDNYLRFKAGVGYKIPDFKLKPEVSFELFEELASKSIQKVRYSLGGAYAFNKTHSFGLTYKRDDFKTEQKFVNIMDMNYKLKF